jgi:hypothetical protein
LQAEGAREITWDDLMPFEEFPASPLDHLTPEIAIQLHGLMGIRAQKEAGRISDVSPLYERGVEIEYDLKSRGVEVEELIARYKDWEAEIGKLDRSVVTDLDAQEVRLPGYALPLEFTGTEVREFLLVPYVGACIHVPPPPPNQMVLVQLAEPYAIEDVFAPVWIEGRLRLEENEKSLYLTDGASSVLSGYTMEEATVEPYEVEN